MITLSENQVAELSPRINSYDSDAAGGIVDFYYLSNSLGLKLYEQERTRDSNYIMQHYMHGCNLCPMVYNKIDICGKFGFVTELCEPITDILNARALSIANYITKEKNLIKHIREKKYSSFRASCQGQIRNFIKTIPKFIRCQDMHMSNVGLSYSDGSLRFIDVGNFEVTRYGLKTLEVDTSCPIRLSQALIKQGK